MTILRKIGAAVAALGVSMALTTAPVQAAETADGAPTHFPIIKPVEQDWSFAGPFGHYDKGQLQRGFKVYREVCAACHTMNRVAFHTLEDLGYSDEQVKTIAAEYDITDGPNADGEMFTRPGTLADHFSGPYANREAAMAANGGAYPPDFSLLAKARGVERGFPLFVFDIFTQYQEGGVDYIYNLLIGYSDDVPANVEVQDGLYYNPYFVSGAALAMAPPLSDDVVTYDDGTPATVDQMSRDVAAFMMWAAEPKLEARKQMGFRVMIFLLIFAALLYIAKKQVYSRIEH